MIFPAPVRRSLFHTNPSPFLVACGLRNARLIAMENKVKVLTVFGTRPEAIKMAPLLQALSASPYIESRLCVTAQHREMLDQVLEIFDLHPDHDLNIMTPRQTLEMITVKALTGLGAVMEEEQPNLVLVHGDTSTTFAAALSAFYHQIPVGHVEAGLRTYDKYQPFPEEMNRRLTGVLADLNFSPTPLARERLLKENTDPQSIYVTGNTVIDALQTTIAPDYVFTEEALNHIDFQNRRVLAVTAHRRENLGEPLLAICRAFRRLVQAFPDVELVYAVHKNPVVQAAAATILEGLSPEEASRVHLLPPLDLRDMHNLMNRSYLVLTDSGGLQEEVPSLGKPVLVLRNVTERPEGVTAGTLRLVGSDEEAVFQNAYELLTDPQAYAQMAQAKNPFGDGHASERIVAAILHHFKNMPRPADYI